MYVCMSFCQSVCLYVCMYVISLRIWANQKLRNILNCTCYIYITLDEFFSFSVTSLSTQNALIITLMTTMERLRLKKNRTNGCELPKAYLPSDSCILNILMILILIDLNWLTDWIDHGGVKRRNDWSNDRRQCQGVSCWFHLIYLAYLY